MAPDLTANPILARFRTVLGELYGDRLARVVLYGSRARGDHRADSDYDIAVFINNPGALGAELHRLADVETDILCETGAVINALPFPAEAYGERTGFMLELREDGLEL